MINNILVFLFWGMVFLNAMEVSQLEKKSLLYQSEELTKQYLGNQIQWKHPYALPKTQALLEQSSVWFTSYGNSTLTRNDESLWQFLGNNKLWDAFNQIGIDGIHLGPIKISGQIIQDQISPTQDGGFDPIGYELNPNFGSIEQYLQFTKTVQKYRSTIIGDLIPGHTGRGYDFELALMNYKDYPGIYHMVEINPNDWHLLPEVSKHAISQNLTISEVEQLRKKGYIVGQLERVLFYDPINKQTNWDITKEIVGVDNKKRRWIYLHYFKSNQPSLNWLDPSFAANRIIAADLIVSIRNLQQKILRLDANAYLGIEINPELKKSWSQGHPLFLVASDMIAMMTRKFGGYSFQELNLPLDEIKASMNFGCDLSYDFLLRSASFHALITENSEFLRLCYQILLNKGLQPIQFVHALQNHDELNMELMQFFDNREKYFYQGNEYFGSEIRKKVLDETLFNNVNYIQSIESGPCTTLAGLCATAIHVQDLFNMTQQEIEMVKKAHLLLAFFSAMQPGAFAISGWDLVGALPIEKPCSHPLTQKEDKRWMNRGSYDLLGYNCSNIRSKNNLPKAISLYGSLQKQLKDPSSFTSQLKKYLKIRKDYGISLAHLVCVLPTKNPSVFVLVHKLPGIEYLQISALNFSQKSKVEIIEMPELANTNAINMLTRKNEKKHVTSTKFTIYLNPLEGKSIVFEPYRY